MLPFAVTVHCNKPQEEVMRIEGWGCSREGYLVDGGTLLIGSTDSI